MSFAPLSAAPSTITACTLFVVGATGRSGLPFVRQALHRGHTVHVYVRNPNKLPADLVGASSSSGSGSVGLSGGGSGSLSGSLHVHVGAVDDVSAVSRALSAAKPHVIVSTLSSDDAPYNAISTSTQTILQALTDTEQKEQEQLGVGGRCSYLSISAMGVGPTESHLVGWAYQKATKLFKATMWNKPSTDMAKQMQLLEQAKKQRVISQCGFVCPPLLTNGPLTQQYQAGDIDTKGSMMSITSSVSRQDVAHYLLTLAEQSAQGQTIPTYTCIKHK